MVENPKYDFKKVAHTAYEIAHARTFTDVPHADGVLNQLMEIGGWSRKQIEKHSFIGLIPFYEARYLLTDLILKRSGIKQVLEVAAGLSLRSWEMTSDTSVTYVELDQSKIVGMKKSIMDNLGIDFRFRSNLAFRSGNALTPFSMSRAAEDFFTKKAPISILNEGFMPYLTHPEIDTYGSRRIHPLLTRYGGIWQTPDIFIKDALRGMPGLELFIAKWKKRVGRNLDTNRFDNVKQEQQFIQGLGFSVELHTFAEVWDQLVSPERLNLPRKQIRDVICRQSYFVMQAR